MYFRILFLLAVISLIPETLKASEIVPIEKKYSKEYYSNGNLKSEGWQSVTSKMGYWYFYHPNGTVKAKGHFKENQRDGYWYFYDKNENLIKEGHYTHGNAEDWWIFYDIANQNKSKFQYRNNKKNGFALRYNKKKLVKAEKYINDDKVGEWESVIAFKQDNPNVSLR